MEAIRRRRAATNTTTTYGWVERAFHWALALLIPTAIALGVWANGLPFDSDAALARKAAIFSLHKTVGVTILFVALARIAWALSQPRPRPLHPERGAETALAATVHWLLYGSLVLVPTMGWLHHASAEGFAPILWPFGQSLPLVPKDPDLSARFATLHIVFERVLVIALLLHVAGAAKHALWDRDATLARMWRGAEPGPLPDAPHRRVLPLGAAALVWAAALGAGLALAPGGPVPASVATAPAAGDGEVAANWTVEDGTVAITVAQLGSPVTGSFAEWSAAIDFDPTPRADGTLGQVEARIATGSLSLGSVSAQATGADFLDAGAFPEAVFRARILPEDGAYVADGTLSLRGVEVPLRLPFDLVIDGDAAAMTGTATLDRRDFGIGAVYADETSVGFPVEVEIAVNARRGG